MATTRADTAVDRTQTIIDWARINSRYLTTGAVVIVVAAAAYWFYARSEQIKAARADQMLLTAKQSVSAGNAALATSDLQKLINGYGSTNAAAEAAMLLAQIDYDQGKYQDGIDALQKAASTHGSDIRTALYSLIGDGYTQMNKLDDAASYYQKAADATTLQDTKANQLAKAARTYAAAGKKDQALKLWTQLSQDDSVPAVATEAHVRLGELQAKPAS